MAKKVPEDSLPEVMTFLEARDRLQRLRDAHPKVFAQLEEVASDYNAALEAAARVVKARGVTCGPFNAYQESVSYDADKLYDALGHDRFLEVGGRITTVSQRDVDKAKLESYIAANAIDKATLKDVRSTSLRYKKPSKIEI